MGEGLLSPGYESYESLLRLPKLGAPFREFQKRCKARYGFEPCKTDQYGLFVLAIIEKSGIVQEVLLPVMDFIDRRSREEWEKNHCCWDAQGPALVTPSGLLYPISLSGLYCIQLWSVPDKNRVVYRFLSGKKGTDYQLSRRREFGKLTEVDQPIVTEPGVTIRFREFATESDVGKQQNEIALRLRRALSDQSLEL